MKLDISSLYTTGLVGIAYFVRIVGKYIMHTLGVVSTSPRDKAVFGLGLILQAGVAIGL